MNKKVLILLLAVIALHLFGGASLQLHFDEAYYWVWGQNLSLSYFDHPPMLAYILYLSSLLGHSEFWVRLPIVLSSTITLITIFLLAKRIFDIKTANLALIIAIASPFIEGAFFVVTPDSPLIMFWALSLYTFYLAFTSDKLFYFCLSGVFLGGALLSKYTAVLLVPSMLLFCIFNTTAINRYATYCKLCLAYLIALVIFAPVIIWNYQHQWVSFIYQIHHGVGTVNRSLWGNLHLLSSLQQLANFFGGQLLIAGPILFIFMLYAVIQQVYHYRLLDKVNVNCQQLPINGAAQSILGAKFLFWPFIFGFCFFALCSIFTPSNANWPMPCYISGIVLLAHWINHSNLVRKKFIYKISLAIMLCVLVLARFPLLFIPYTLHDKIPLNAFYGNREFFTVVKKYIKPDTVVLACDYGNASRAWYYLGIRTYVLADMPFANGYRYWQQPRLPINNALYICDNDDTVALSILHKHFKQIELLQIVDFSNAITTKHSYIYKVSN